VSCSNELLCATWADSHNRSKTADCGWVIRWTACNVK